MDLAGTAKAKRKKRKEWGDSKYDEAMGRISTENWCIDILCGISSQKNIFF